MAKNLLLYAYSGYDEGQKNKILQYFGDLNDLTIALIEDAVIGASKKEIEQTYKAFLERGIKVLCLEEDFRARGYNSEGLAENINLINYDSLIDEIANAGKIISWT